MTVTLVRGSQNSPMIIHEADVENLQTDDYPQFGYQPLEYDEGVLYRGVSLIHIIYRERNHWSVRFRDQSERPVTGEELFNSTSATRAKCDCASIEISCDIDDRGDDIPSIRYLFLSIGKRLSERLKGICGHRF